MTKLARYFLKHNRITHMLVGLISLAGILSMFLLKRQANPPINFDILTVTTIYPGASPEDVEINVTRKLEKQLKEIENIKKMESISSENLSIITLHLDPQTKKPEKIKAKIRDSVARAQSLPTGIADKPIVEELSTSGFPALEIAISGGENESVLREHARNLEKRLKEIYGTGRVSMVGFRRKEIHINAVLEKMKQEQISFQQILYAIQNRNIRESGGSIGSYVSEKKIITLSKYNNIEDVKNVILRSNFSGNRLLLDSVAEIQSGFEKANILYRGNGKPGIGMVISPQDHADIIDLNHRLSKEIKQYKKDLPDNIHIDIVFDYSVYTKIMIQMVSSNGFIGFLLVIFVMYIFLDARSAFWSAFGIPFSILGALILFPLFNLNLNNISLITMILVLGIIVDDAIVITEKIYSNKQEGMPPEQATIEGIKSMALPVSASILTTIFAFGPILFISGIFGKFLYPIPIVVMLLLALSWIESIFFLPAHLQHIPAPTSPPKRSLWVYQLRDFYHKQIQFMLNHKYSFFLLFFLLLACIYFLSFQFLELYLDSEKDADFFTIQIETKNGSSLSYTNRAILPLESLVKKEVPQDAIKGYTTKVGTFSDSYSLGLGGQQTNYAIITVYLKTANHRNITSEQIIEKIRPKIEQIERQDLYKKITINKLGAGLSTGSALQLELISENNKLRNEFKQKIVQYLQKYPGVENPETNEKPGKDEIQINFDYEKLARAGLTALEVAGSIRATFDGIIATSVNWRGEDIKFRIKLKNPQRFQSENILELPIANQQGNLIPLKYLAGFSEKQGTSAIRHYKGSRSVQITANVNKKILNPKKLNEDIQAKFQPLINHYPELSIHYGGQQEELLLSLRGFLIAFLIALISIYFLLVIVFDSYSLPFMIMSIIPFAIGGVLLTLLIHKEPLTFIALISSLGLIGVAVNDTIVMIKHIHDTCKQIDFSITTIARASSQRFRAVILTTLTTFAGLLPSSYGFGGDIPEIRPMILTMAWGLVFSTFITLGFVPILFSIIKTNTTRRLK